MKKFVLIFIALVFSLSLGSCNNSSVSKEIIIWNAGMQTTDDSGKIKKEDLPYSKAVIEFEKSNLGYKVTTVDYSMDDLQKAFTAANLSKKGPDMVALWAGSATQAYKDYLIDFKKVLSNDELKLYDNSLLLHKDSKKDESLMGLTYGMPSTFVMYYNKDIFAKNNLEVPKTLEELNSVSKTLKEKSITPMVVGDKDGYTSTWVLSSLLANVLGPDNINKLGDKTELMSSSNFQDSLKTWKDYIDAGNTNKDYLTLSDGDAIQNFMSGNSAMIIHGNWAAREFNNMGENVGVTKIPIVSNSSFKDYMVSQPNINLVVTNYSQNQKKAVEFTKMLVNEKYNKEANAAFYTDPVAERLIGVISKFEKENKNVTGFDSIITGESAGEFYKLVPTYISGSLKLEDLTKKLDELNVKK